ncbi:hypothetical protein [Sediminibacterium sp.]|uniref:hypothetical protein n=1 Tax=Sediminibacterium sp. TaxID=1917865 RepID=UPI0025E5D51D|nr:hypothetical protein [Sediminibacterium sp.]MBT9485707.1 hypothetical protein [Sediminibacterium sp.]
MNETLLNKYDRLFESKRPIKYYHFNTTYNLIKHLNSFEDGKKKEEMYFKLNEYLDYISENDLLNARESIAIYTKYLRPVTFYYEKKLGFMYFAKWRTILLLVLIPSFILSLFFDSISAWSIILVADLAIINYFYQKYKEHKTYGHMW